jgi:hypothetical protein
MCKEKKELQIIPRKVSVPLPTPKEKLRTGFPQCHASLFRKTNEKSKFADATPMSK